MTMAGAKLFWAYVGTPRAGPNPLSSLYEALLVSSISNLLLLLSFSTYNTHILS